MATPTRRNRRFLQAPTPAKVQDLAASEYMTMDEEMAANYAEVLRSVLDNIEDLEELPIPETGARYGTRDAGYTPTLEEDPFAIFTRKCRIEGSGSGPLAGRTFAVKDNIAVAGLPITNSSRHFRYTPRQDAVVVERLLDAGAILVGKVNLDDYASGATGETSYYGPSRNPVNPDYASGGSSGGSGAVVAAGESDFSLGIDQGGSGRIPASFCGVTALKATHGLIPSHGSTHLDHTIDFVTPMAKSVREVAEITEVVAGPDWRDGQWVRGDFDATGLGSVEPADLSKLTVGIVPEGCDPEVCEPEVLEAFQRTVSLLEEAGATVDEVSIPLWGRGWAIESVMLIHLAGNMIKSEGCGYGHMGQIDIDRVHAFALSRRVEADAFPPLVKTWILAERYLHDKYLNLSYARCHNLRLVLRKQVIDALEGFDVLLTPGTPTTAPRLSNEKEEETQIMGRVPSAVYNSCPLNLSGHPALVMPNGANAAGLPTSVQVFGRSFDEAGVVSASLAIEAALAQST